MLGSGACYVLVTLLIGYYDVIGRLGYGHENGSKAYMYVYVVSSRIQSVAARSSSRIRNGYV